MANQQNSNELFKEGTCGDAQTAEGNMLHQHNLISKVRFYFFSCSVMTQISSKCVNRQVIVMNKTRLSDNKVPPLQNVNIFITLC